MRPAKSSRNEAVPVSAPKVEVMNAVPRSATVPYVKPDWVASAPPVSVIAPFNVMDEVETDEASEVAMVEVATAAIGITAFEADEGELVPISFTAYTVNEYDVPLVSPEMIIGEVTEVAAMLSGVDDAK